MNGKRRFIAFLLALFLLLGASQTFAYTSGTDPAAVSGSSHTSAAPVVTITSPDVTNYATNSSSISLAGTAKAKGKIESVTWTNSLGGEGVAEGRKRWSLPNIDLKEGTNVITVTATDRTGNTGSAFVRVIYTPDTALAPIVPDTTEVLDSTSLAHLTSISPDGSALMFTGIRGATQITTLSPGDVIVVNPTAEAPYGLLRKVSNVQVSADQVIVQTTQANLEDAIEQGSIHISQTLTPDEVSSASAALKGVNIGASSFTKSSAPTTQSLGSFTIPLANVVLFDADGNYSTTNDQVKATGNINIAPSYSFDLDVQWFEIKKISFKETTTETAELAVTAGLSAEFSKKVKVASYTFSPIKFMIGYVPVWITPTLTVYVGLDGKVSTSLTTSVTQQATLTAGLQYDNGNWSTIHDFSNSFQYNPPTLTADASVKGYAGPELSLMLYSVAGPHGEIDGYLKLNADLFGTPWWVLYGGLDAGLGVKFEVLGYKKDYSTSFNLMEIVIAQADGGYTPPGPGPEPGPSPGPGPSETYSFLTKWGSQGTGDGQFNGANGIAVDAGGNVYVTDSGNSRVQKFDSNGNFVTKWGGPGTADGQFNFPYGIAADGSGNVYVADANSYFIQKFDSNGNFLTKWGGPGTGDAQFGGPSGIAVDGSGNVYVADGARDYIRKFDSNGTFLRKWGGTGRGDGQFTDPEGVAVDGSGNVYVTDLHNPPLDPFARVQKFDSNGTFLAKWGSYGYGDGQFWAPYGIAVDAGGNVYVADSGNSRVQKFDSNGTFLVKWGSSGSGDGQFNFFYGIAVDAGGNVYVADSGNSRIQKFGPQSP